MGAFEAEPDEFRVEGRGRKVQGQWLTRLRQVHSGWARLAAGVLQAEGWRNWPRDTRRRDEATRQHDRLGEELIFRSEDEGSPIRPSREVFPEWAWEVEDWCGLLPPCWLHLRYNFGPDVGGYRELLPVCLVTMPPVLQGEEEWIACIVASRRWTLQHRWAELALGSLFLAVLRQGVPVWRRSYRYTSASMLAAAYVDHVRRWEKKCVLGLRDFYLQDEVDGGDMAEEKAVRTMMDLVKVLERTCSPATALKGP